ncbi:hypothetical protein GWI33_002429 [Rhynchophorus ferrugineus]|uniref:Uncharacterized protein n=1 Tax=Rhynchophorus ferrugineus TaxID=354439 RepID=A0A834IX49_RHYFE|nr:hypothetical protein GWI33_002429 [Rhynchophorus ferrugineus]
MCHHQHPSQFYTASKEGAATFYSIHQSRWLICKSNNTPNYQVNMAILYGRWKEVYIWLGAEKDDARRPTASETERDGHIDIITITLPD